MTLRPGIRRRLRSGVTRASNWLRPVAPPAVWELFTVARSVAGAGPVVAVPGFERAMVIAPHPDDETIGCGGTAALLAESGCAVSVLCLSSGEASVLVPASGPTPTAARREEQARRACQRLGVGTPEFARLPDGGVGRDEETLDAILRRALAEHRPQAVFAPWPLDGHPDHAAVPAGLARLSDLKAQIWCYEVWSALPPNRLVDVSSVWDRKCAALECHHDGDGFDLDAHLALHRWRSIHGFDGHGWAEAFLVLRPDQLRLLVAGTGS